MIPNNYELELHPNFDTFEYEGSVKIEIKVTTETSEIKLNSKFLVIHSAELNYNNNTSQIFASNIIYDTNKETVTFNFNSLLETKLYSLIIKFRGIHSDNMAGFYRSSYIKNGYKQWILVSQMAACDCRAAFPCFDNPGLKSTFDITLHVPLNLTALSNMEIEKESIRNGVKIVKFAQTPRMSTYLVAFAVGEFEYLEKIARPVGGKPITVRVYTNMGDKEKGRYGLDIAVKSLEFFSEYFDIAYPLPKLDMLPVPDFAFGAMENWGLVTYRSIILLCDENTSSLAKQGLTYTISHEIGHQWFGNLVTMEWWTDLWLNEGFATFVGWVFTDHFFPEWDVFTQFLQTQVSKALELDALRSSHPIEVAVKDTSEIGQIFDAISYSKGAAIIVMLNWTLGKEVFTKGVQSYLKKYAYKNAITQNLWQHLSRVSNFDVESMMKSWTLKTGYPMVTVISEYYDEAKQEMTIKLRQNRFLSNGDIDKNDDEDNKKIWSIPLGLFTNDSEVSKNEIMTLKEESFHFPYVKDKDSFWKLNYKSRGLFRVNLNPEQLQLLGDAKTLSVSDKIGLLSDAFSMAKAVYGATSVALGLLKKFEDEEDYNVFYLSSPKVKSTISNLQQKIFSNQIKMVGGWTYQAKESHLTSLKRTLVINSAAKSGHPETVKTLYEKTTLLLINSQKNALDSNLIAAGFSVFVKTADQTTATSNLELIIDYFLNCDVEERRLDALRAIGGSTDLEGLKRFLYGKALDSDVIRAQDLSVFMRGFHCGSSISHLIFPMLWEWLKENWETLFNKLSTNSRLFGSVVDLCITGSVGDEFADSVEAWFRGDGLENADKERRIDQAKGVSNNVKQAVETVRANSKWANRDYKDLNSWVLRQ